jgi:catechol 2,3-dioxygenase
VWSEDDLDRSIAALPLRNIVAERITDHPARRSVTILDPDGIRLQFYVNRDWAPDALMALDDETALHLL